jgi:hypothetical protein
MSEISKIWRLGMSHEDREYYNDFALETRKEYEKQQIEFRATGSFTPSTRFGKLEGTNIWVRTKWEEKNGLEQEVSKYDVCAFPKRPPEYDQEYQRSLAASSIRRKLKLKGLLNDDGTVKDGADIELVKKYESALTGIGENLSEADPSQDIEEGDDNEVGQYMEGEDEVDDDLNDQGSENEESPSVSSNHIVAM